ncbi:hypothetical protein TRVA0_001S05996 [Trichomonascus vanleenenianus]|uniref:zinc finger CCCH domain-containing protein n=1 Tax=Trichomonascus vanleenenianus TaxID=2268995 RepID=UPI003ECAFF09
MENNNFIFFDGHQFHKRPLQGEQNPPQPPPPNAQSQPVPGPVSGIAVPQQHAVPPQYGSAMGAGRPQMPFNNGNQYSIHPPPFDTSYMAGALHHQPDIMNMPYNSHGLHQFSVSPHFNYNNNNNHTPSGNSNAPMLQQYPQAWHESRPVTMAPPAPVRPDMGMSFMGDQVQLPTPIGVPSAIYQQYEEFLPRHFNGQENTDDEIVVEAQRPANPLIMAATTTEVKAFGSAAPNAASVSQPQAPAPPLPQAPLPPHIQPQPQPQAEAQPQPHPLPVQAPPPQESKKEAAEGPRLEEVDKAVFSAKERDAMAKKSPTSLMKERIYALLKKRTESMSTAVELFKKTILACRKEDFGATDPDEIQVAFDMADKSVTSRFWAEFRNANHFLSRMRNWIAAMIKKKRYDSTKSALKALASIPFTEQTLHDLKLKVVLDILEKRGDTLTSKLATRALQSALKRMPAKPTATSRSTTPVDKNPVKLGIASAQKQTNESSFFKSLQNAQQQTTAPTATTTTATTTASKKRDSSAVEATDTKVVKKPAPANSTYSFASHLQTIKRGPLKQTSPTVVDKKEDEKPKEKPTKNVRWKDEESLVEIKYFELFPEEISSRKRVRDIKDLDHEEALALHNEATEGNTGPPVESIEWYDPPKLELSEQQDEMPIKRGGELIPHSPATEAELQRQSESFVRPDTPDSPDEPVARKETRNKTAIMVLPDRINKDPRMNGFLEHVASTGVEPSPLIPKVSPPPPAAATAPVFPAVPAAPGAQDALKMLTQLINANKTNPAIANPPFDMGQMQAFLHQTRNSGPPHQAPPNGTSHGPSYGYPHGPSNWQPHESSQDVSLEKIIELRKRDVRPDVAHDTSPGYKHRHPCAFFRKGRCNYGNDCNFIHLKDE